jgi:purine-binding chemotaxis protein CheW
MRPLPIDRLPSAPEFVLGVSMIRGAPTPVVDAGALVGQPDPAPTRFITLKAGERKIALAVESVLGIRALAAASLQPLPPLLRKAGAGVIDTLAALDAELLAVIRLARAVTDRVFEAIETAEARG